MEYFLCCCYSEIELENWSCSCTEYAREARISLREGARGDGLKREESKPTDDGEGVVFDWMRADQSAKYRRSAGKDSRRESRKITRTREWGDLTGFVAGG